MMNHSTLITSSSRALTLKFFLKLTLIRLKREERAMQDENLEVNLMHEEIELQ